MPYFILLVSFSSCLETIFQPLDVEKCLNIYFNGLFELISENKSI